MCTSSTTILLRVRIADSQVCNFRQIKVQDVYSEHVMTTCYPIELNKF